jgi:hypothetical protein
MWSLGSGGREAGVRRRGESGGGFPCFGEVDKARWRRVAIGGRCAEVDNTTERIGPPLGIIIPGWVSGGIFSMQMLNKHRPQKFLSSIHFGILYNYSRCKC